MAPFRAPYTVVYTARIANRTARIRGQKGGMRVGGRGEVGLGIAAIWEFLLGSLGVMTQPIPTKLRQENAG